MRKPEIVWIVLLLLAWFPHPGYHPERPRPFAGKQKFSYGDELDFSQMRYKKGLELIRLLYEKLLSLDHHFSTMRTGQLIQGLGNPLSYAPFREHATVVGKEGQKHAMPLMPGFGFENPSLAAAGFLAETYAAASPRPLPREELERLTCILDFSLRVHSDLRQIAYETEFLAQANSQLQEECRELFGDYTRVIGYSVPIDRCRSADDWDAVALALDRHIRSMRQRMESNAPEDRQQLIRDHINLEFSVDRLLNFIRNYQFHIQQGGQYYQKFRTILEGHSPNAACAEEIPPAWGQLKDEVALSVESFCQAYEVPEFKGSRLKDLLYGFSD